MANNRSLSEGLTAERMWDFDQEGTLMAKVLLGMARRIADTVMEERPGLISRKWAYDTGLFLIGL